MRLKKSQMHGKIFHAFNLKELKLFFKKKSALTKAINRISVIPIKLPTEFLTEMGQKILRFTWTHTTPQTAKETGKKKKNKVVNIMLPGFKLYYKAIVTKTE